MRIVPFSLALPIVFVICLTLGGSASVVCALTAAISISLIIYPKNFFTSHHALRICAFLFNSMLISFLALRFSSRLARERNRALELLRENEVRTQLALDGANAGIWDWNIEKNTSTWSEGHCRLHGYEPGKVKPGYEAWRASLYPDDLAAVEMELEKARREHLPFETEYRVVWPDGQIRWIISKARFQYDSNGTAVRLVGTSGDITERKRTTTTLLQSEKLAVVGRLTASIAHEINNPLEAMTNLLYLCLQDTQPGEVRDWLEMASKELERVSLIAQQTLRYSRTSGELALMRPSALLESSIAIFDSRIAHSQIDVVRDYADDPPFHCLPGDMRQIFVNLVGNAIDAMPRGGNLVLRVRQARDWRNGYARGIRITIADTGTGMDERTRRQIFEPFFTTKGETGTGLGLWVLDQLVNRHYGYVQVRSRKGDRVHGTVFSMFFPYGITASQIRSQSAA